VRDLPARADFKLRRDVTSYHTEAREYEYRSVTM